MHRLTGWVYGRVVACWQRSTTNGVVYADNTYRWSTNDGRGRYPLVCGIEYTNIVYCMLYTTAEREAVKMTLQEKYENILKNAKIDVLQDVVCNVLKLLEKDNSCYLHINNVVMPDVSGLSLTDTTIYIDHGEYTSMVRVEDIKHLWYSSTEMNDCVLIKF